MTYGIGDSNLNFSHIMCMPPAGCSKTVFFIIIEAGPAAKLFTLLRLKLVYMWRVLFYALALHFCDLGDLCGSLNLRKGSSWPPEIPHFS